jgi:hypothetical protein
MKKSFVMAAATVFAAGTLVASIASAQTPNSPSFGDTSLACKGINACKGQSACKSGANSCKGQNACKGQGWVAAKSRLDCQAAGGSSVGF